MQTSWGSRLSSRFGASVFGLNSGDDGVDRSIQELKPILRHPRQLAHLSQYIADFTEQAEVVKAQLYATYERTLSDIMLRYKRFPAAAELVREMHSDFSQIVGTAEQCMSLFEHRDVIRTASLVSRNMNGVDNLLSQLSAVPRRLQSIRDTLARMQGDRDPRVDRKIKDLYLSLRQLVLLRNRIWREGNQSSAEFRQNVLDEFGAIDATAATLEKAVLENVWDSLALCKDDSATLIRSLMVIEMEDHAKTKVFAKFNPTLFRTASKHSHVSSITGATPRETAPNLSAASSLNPVRGSPLGSPQLNVTASLFGAAPGSSLGDEGSSSSLHRYPNGRSHGFSIDTSRPVVAAGASSMGLSTYSASPSEGKAAVTRVTRTMREKALEKIHISIINSFREVLHEPGDGFVGEGSGGSGTGDGSAPSGLPSRRSSINTTHSGATNSKNTPQQQPKDEAAEKLSTEKIIERLEVLLLDLKLVVEDLEPLFPPDYDIARLYLSNYTKYFIADIGGRLSNPASLPQAALLKWSAWIQKFDKLMTSFGYELPLILKKDQVERLACIYKEKSYTHLRKPVDNCLEKERVEKPIQVRGKPRMQGPRDLFGIIHRHWDNVCQARAQDAQAQDDSNMSPRVVLEVAKTYTGTLVYCQRQQIRYLETLEIKEGKDEFVGSQGPDLCLFFNQMPKDDKYVCAWINSAREYSESTKTLHRKIRAQMEQSASTKASLPVTPLHVAVSSAPDSKSDSNAGGGKATTPGARVRMLLGELDSMMEVARVGFHRLTLLLSDALAGYIVALSKREFEANFSRQWHVRIVSGVNQSSDGRAAEDSSMPTPSSSNSPLVVIAQEIQLAMADYSTWIEDPDDCALLAERVLRTALDSYCYHLASTRKRRLSAPQRDSCALAILRDVKELKAALRRERFADGTRAFVFGSSTLDKCFVTVEFLHAFLRETSWELAAAALRKHFWVLLDNLKDEARALVASVARIRADMSSSAQRDILADFDSRQRDWTEEGKARSTESIAQRLQLPWCDLGRVAQETKDEASGAKKTTSIWRKLFPRSNVGIDSAVDEDTKPAQVSKPDHHATAAVSARDSDEQIDLDDFLSDSDG